MNAQEDSFRTTAHVEDERRWSRMMIQAQAGETAIYTALLHELAGVIEAYIRVHFGRIDILEDCVQECLMTLHQARHTYDRARPFRPWLFTLVRHRTIDELRRRTWRLDPSAWPPGADRDNSHVDWPRLMDAIRMLRLLPRENSEAIALVKYVGLTTAEAARELGISESALKARLQRGLKAIAALLEEEDES